MSDDDTLLLRVVRHSPELITYVAHDDPREFGEAVAMVVFSMVGNHEFSQRVWAAAAALATELRHPPAGRAIKPAQAARPNDERAGGSEQLDGPAAEQGARHEQAAQPGDAGGVVGGGVAGGGRPPSGHEHPDEPGHRDQHDHPAHHDPDRGGEQSDVQGEHTVQRREGAQPSEPRPTFDELVARAGALPTTGMMGSGAPPVLVVHALLHGVALCGAGRPTDWPPADRWAWSDDPADVTCPRCHGRSNG